MVSPFLDLGFDFVLVKTLTDDELREVSAKAAKSLMALNHPDHGGDPERFKEAAIILKAIAGGDIASLRKGYLAETAPENAQVSSGMKELEEARVHNKIAKGPILSSGKEDDSSWYLHRARNWAKTFFSSKSWNWGYRDGTTASVNLRHLPGTEVMVMIDRKGRLPELRRGTELAENKIMMLEGLTFPDQSDIRERIQDLQKTMRNCPKGAEYDILSEIGNLSHLLRSIHDAMNELATAKKTLLRLRKQIADVETVAEKRLQVDEDGVLRIGKESLHIIGSSTVFEPVYLSEAYPHIIQGYQLACIRNDGRMQTVGRFIGHETLRARIPQDAEIVDAQDPDGMDRPMDPSRALAGGARIQGENPYSALGLLPCILRKLGPEKAPEYAMRHGKAILALFKESGGERGELARKASAAIYELRNPSSKDVHFSGFLMSRPNEHKERLLSEQIRTLGEETMRVGIRNAKAARHNMDLSSLRRDAELFIRILLESVYGNLHFVPGMGNASFLHQSGGTSLRIETPKGEIECTLERKGLDIWAEFDDGRERVFGTSMPIQANGTEAGHSEPVSIQEAFVLAKPLIMQGGDLILTKDDVVYSAGRIVGITPKSREGKEMASDYSSFLKNVDSASSKLRGRRTGSMRILRNL